MKKMLFVVLVWSSFLLPQDSRSTSQDTASNDNVSGDHAKDSKGAVTVQGCVSRASGDYILMKQDPAVTYELQAANKIKLSHYLGQRVEVIGKESPSMSTSSDNTARSGSPSPVTLTITSIKTLDKECSERQAER
jgi:hypothetical protein